MTRREFESVLERMRLPNGLPWTIPIVKQLSAADRRQVKRGDHIALTDHRGKILAVQRVRQIFSYPKRKYARKVYGTDETEHPGVANVYAMGDFFVGGEIWLLQRPPHNDFLKYRLSPRQIRAMFKARGWRRVVAFQTRNPIHRAHEYIQKCALEMVDGLLIHPLVGKTWGKDVPARVRMKCYELIIKNYFPKDQVVLSVFPAHMRYAGPREAVFHAIVRKNYGCTHFIVGRDHAGAPRPDGGSYYGPFDAQFIFDNFKHDEIGITPLFFDFTFYCKKCGEMVSSKTCPHDSSCHVSLSGRKVREMLTRGKFPPPEFTRPEMARILIKAYRRK